LIRLQDEPIRPAELLAAVRRSGDGAVALFTGTVRDHSHGRAVVRLHYDAYREMARREMAALRSRALETFDVSDIAIVHRLGPLEIGEISVAVAVSAPHRAPAFEACRFVIDTLKRTVPIWKKEIFEDGESWVEGPSG
jgi:molybdopterin synthase catalytic subunit